MAVDMTADLASLAQVLKLNGMQPGGVDISRMGGLAQRKMAMQDAMSAFGLSGIEGRYRMKRSDIESQMMRDEEENKAGVLDYLGVGLSGAGAVKGYLDKRGAQKDAFNKSIKYQYSTLSPSDKRMLQTMGWVNPSMMFGD